MLHIIFLILKILGFVLLAVFGIVILLLAALILLPAHYKAALSWNGTAESLKWRVKFHWLIHLISGEAVYENGTLIWKFRAAWKRSDSAGEYGTDTYVKPEKNNSTVKEAGSGVKKAIKTDRQNPEKSVSSPEKTPHPRSSVQHNISREPIPEQHIPKEKEEKEKKVKEASFFEKISAYRDKIKYTFQKICANIKSLTKKKEKLQRFLTNEIHKKAFSRTIKELKRLLRYLRPKKLEGNIEFGFQDPAHTGYLLAGISIIYPLIGEYVDIRADFEHEVLNGSLLAEGKLRLLYVLIPAWNLFFDRNVKVTYRHLRRFKL